MNERRGCRGCPPRSAAFVPPAFASRNSSFVPTALHSRTTFSSRVHRIAVSPGAVGQPTEADAERRCSRRTLPSMKKKKRGSKYEKGKWKPILSDNPLLSDHIEQINLDLKARRLQAALSCFEDMCGLPWAAGEHIYSQLMLDFGRVGTPQHAERVLLEARRRLVYTKSARGDGREELRDKVGVEGHGEMEAHSHDGSRRGGAAKRQWNSRGAETSPSPQPRRVDRLSVDTYNNLLRSYAYHRDVDGMMRTLERMQEEGIAPNGSSYYELIQATRNCRDFERFEQVYARLSRGGVRKDRAYFKAVLQYFAHHGMLEAMELAVFEMEESYAIKSDLETYNLRITAMAHHNDLRSAEQLIGEMKGRMMRPTEDSFTALLRGCIRTKDAERVRSAYMNMKMHKARPNLLAFAPLMRLMSELRDQAGARFYLREMRINKVRPNHLVYQATVSLALKRGDVAYALETIRRMIVADVAPRSSLYHLFFGWAAAAQGSSPPFSTKRRRLPPPAAVFAWLEEFGIVRDNFLVALLLDGYLTTRDFAQATRLLRTLAREQHEADMLRRELQLRDTADVDNDGAAPRGGDREGLGYDDENDEADTPAAVPFIGYYNVVMGWLCRNGQLEAAQTLLEDMQARGVDANVRTYSALTCGHAEAGHASNTVRLLQTMRARQMLVRRRMRAAVRRARRRDSAFERAKLLVREMDAEAIDYMARRSMIPRKKIRKELFLKREKFAKVWKVFEELLLRLSRLQDLQDGELFQRSRYYYHRMFDFGERSDSFQYELDNGPKLEGEFFGGGGADDAEDSSDDDHSDAHSQHEYTAARRSFDEAEMLEDDDDEQEEDASEDGDQDDEGGTDDDEGAWGLAGGENSEKAWADGAAASQHTNGEGEAQSVKEDEDDEEEDNDAEEYDDEDDGDEEVWDEDDDGDDDNSGVSEAYQLLMQCITDPSSV